MQEEKYKVWTEETGSIWVTKKELDKLHEKQLANLNKGPRRSAVLNK